jgi:hypothetical protein
MTSAPNPSLTAQTRQFERNPGHGESVMTALAHPSAAAVAGEAWSLAKIHDPIVKDGHGNRVSGYVAKSNPAPLLPRNRDAFRDENDSASTVDPNHRPVAPSVTAAAIAARAVAHRDPYRDQADSVGIVRTVTPT